MPLLKAWFGQNRSTPTWLSGAGKANQYFLGGFDSKPQALLPCSPYRGGALPRAGASRTRSVLQR